MRILTLLPSIILFTFIVGCSNDDSLLNEVQIRVTNSSIFQYSDVTVNTGGGTNNYGNISASESSDYVIFSSAFRYAFVQVEIEGETFTIQPIDYVGESLFATGKYTYEINANSGGTQFDRLSLTLIKD